MMSTFQETFVWRRLSEKSAVRYSCFLCIESGKYAVQSADFFNLPLSAEQMARSSKQFIELFIEVPPSERCTWHDSVSDAISAHVAEFDS